MPVPAFWREPGAPHPASKPDAVTIATNAASQDPSFMAIP
jgi:hypothetical protein